MANVKSASENLTIGPFRLSYPHLDKPSSQPGNPALKYSASLIFPKNNTKLKALLDEAINKIYERSEKLKKDGKKLPMGALRLPINDGDVTRSTDEAYKDSFYLSAKSDDKPGLFDAKAQKLMDMTELYAGCYVYASINLYDYDKGGYGIAIGLNGIQKYKDGEALTKKGQVSFEAIQDDDEI